LNLFDLKFFILLLKADDLKLASILFHLP